MWNHKKVDHKVGDSSKKLEEFMKRKNTYSYIVSSLALIISLLVFCFIIFFKKEAFEIIKVFQGKFHLIILVQSLPVWIIAFLAFILTYLFCSYWLSKLITSQHLPLMTFGRIEPLELTYKSFVEKNSLPFVFEETETSYGKKEWGAPKQEPFKYDYKPKEGIDLEKFKIVYDNQKVDNNTLNYPLISFPAGAVASLNRKDNVITSNVAASGVYFPQNYYNNPG